MDLKELEVEIMRPAPGERAKLAEKILRSLDRLSESELERIWLEEAYRRDREMDRDPSIGIPAEEFFSALRSQYL